MSGNQIAAGAVHVAHLLGEVAGGEELNAFGLVLVQRTSERPKALQVIFSTRLPEPMIGMWVMQ